MHVLQGGKHLKVEAENVILDGRELIFHFTHVSILFSVFRFTSHIDDFMMSES